MPPTAPWDVIVAGAGPGGSTVSALLAEQGARVLVLEKEEFPRFHIGESLLPASESIATTLDIDPDPNVFLFKRGAQFVCEKTGRLQAFDFSEALPGPQRYAWHVERASFDTVLRDRAAQVGAVVRHGVSVDHVEFDSSGVRVTGTGSVERGRYFIDASGQDRLLAKQMNSVRSYDRFGKAAAFTHFSELSSRARDEFAPHNDIRIVVIPDGWLWAIPLTGNRLSVGMVTRRPGLRTRHLDDYLADSPLFDRVLTGARRHESRLVGNFSFENDRASGSRYTCVGDSACFIDPVFSSGVSLAIMRAAAVAERLFPALVSGSEGDPGLMAPVEETMSRGYDTFAALVYRFYNTRFVDNMIFGAPSSGEHRAGVISVLAGDVFREDNPYQNLLLASRRYRFRETVAQAREQERAERPS